MQRALPLLVPGILLFCSATALGAGLVIEDLVVDPGTAPGELAIRFSAPERPGGGPVAGYELRTSVLSPTDVPVAWHSSNDTSAGSIAAMS